MTTTALKVTTPTDREIVMTREFNAPRRQVFDAMSKPEFLQKWLSGPPGWTMVECQSNTKAGGAFRHVWHGPDGAEMAMSGVYSEVSPPERIVRTETFEFGCGPQAGEQLATMVLTESSGRTLLTLTVLYPSKEARDGAVASGMEHGVAASYNHLDEVLAAEAALVG